MTSKKIMENEKILGFIFRKGGSGKSTTSQLFTYSKALNRYIKKIGLAELDPQSTIQNWHEEREANNRKQYGVTFKQILDKDPEDIKPKLIELLQDQDLLVLDTPGESIDIFTTKFALQISDIVVIPMRASTNDENAFTLQLLPLIEEVIIEEPERINSFYILPTFFHPQTKIETIKTYFEGIMPDFIQCLPTFLPFRSLYENYNRDGRTIYEYAKSVKNNSRKYQQAQNAINDVESVSKAIIQVLTK